MNRQSISLSLIASLSLSVCGSVSAGAAPDDSPTHPSPPTAVSPRRPAASPPAPSQESNANAEGSTCGDTHLTDADRETLAKATTVICREAGDTNQPSAPWKAFQKYKKFGSRAASEIQTLLDKATPAGRLYGVILLKQFDPKEASKVLTKMKADTTPVHYMRGCCMIPTRVSELAVRISNGEEIVQLEDK